MNLYSYLVVRDVGFAPNPFGDFLTLATCKPTLRKRAELGDWIIGTTSKKGHKTKNMLVYAMRVEEKLTFNQYWADQRFEYKKPVFNKSLVQCYGDNIYHYENDSWIQENSHHSLENGICNERNLKNDLKGKFVLISQTFYYFGNELVEIPTEFRSEVCSEKRFPLYKEIEGDIADEFIDWLVNNFPLRVRNRPYHLSKNFTRFSG